MENRKINVDRPQLKTEEILASKNFDEIVRNHQVMSKPFYKQNWFFGTTGLASLGLIIGGTLAFSGTTDATDEVAITDTPPPQMILAQNTPIIRHKDHEPTNAHQLAQKTLYINQQNKSLSEKKSTQDNPSPSVKNEVKPQQSAAEIIPEPEKTPKMPKKREMPQLAEKPVVAESAVEEVVKKPGFMDMYPRISDKMGGVITRNELLDNKGITTEGDVSIIHFELHLIDGLGGKVFEEEGNQLNEEMRKALENVPKGETIYFENIRGKVKSGAEVKLNPLRYVLLN